MAYDTAFLDRMHCYVPGWDIPKYRPDFFTDEHAFITDNLSEFMKEIREEQFGDAYDKFLKFGSNLNQRDVNAVRKIILGFKKLLYPNGEDNKEDLAEILTISLELRRRVKEQLKKIGGMEFYDVNFSYIDNETFEEHYVPVPEQGGGKLIPEGMPNPGHVYTISRCKTGMVCVCRLETQVLLTIKKQKMINLIYCSYLHNSLKINKMIFLMNIILFIYPSTQCFTTPLW